MNNVTATILQFITIKRILAVASIIAVVYAFLNYAVVFISVDRPDNIPAIVDSTQADHLHEDSQANKTIPDTEVLMSYNLAPQSIGGPGLHIVKRGVDGIEAQAGPNIRSRAALSIPWYGIAYKNLELKIDTNAEKIAYKSTLPQACGVYSKVLDRIAQYACGQSPKTFVHYNTPEDAVWRLESISDLHFPFNTPIHYKGGLLGITNTGGADKTTDDKLLRIVSDQGVVSHLKQPDGVNCIASTCLRADKDTVDEYHKKHDAPVGIFADTKDQTNDRFVFVTSDGTLYLGTPRSGSDVEYRETDAPEWYTAAHQTRCSVSGSSVACYRGLSSRPNSEASSKPAKTELVRLSFDDDTQYTMKLRDNLMLHDFGMTTDGRVFGKEARKLLFFQTNQDNTKAKEVRISNTIDELAVGNDAYYIHGKGVYKVDADTQSARQIFRSINITPQRLIVPGEDVYILGKAPQSIKSPTYAWKLNNQENTQPNSRAIDQLPSSPGSTVFGTTDIVGDLMYIQIPTTSRTVAPTTIENRRQAIIRNLEVSGVDTSKFTIVSP